MRLAFGLSPSLPYSPFLILEIVGVDDSFCAVDVVRRSGIPNVEDFDQARQEHVACKVSWHKCVRCGRVLRRKPHRNRLPSERVLWLEWQSYVFPMKVVSFFFIVENRAKHILECAYLRHRASLSNLDSSGTR